MNTIHVVNGSERAFTTSRFILAFGAYGWTRLMVWADHLEDALDIAVDWIAENAPGLLANEQVEAAYREAIAEGMSEEEAHIRATEDMTCAGNHGDYVASWEWTIVAENPSRSEVLALMSR